MTKRIRKLLLGVAALAALALGGSAFASAQSHTPAPAAPAAESTTGPDTDNVQSGDQTTPDKPATAAKATAAQTTSGADTDKVQSGDQAGPETPDKASATEPAESPETPGSETESANGSDGPGGHADEPANANADHQAQGAE